MLRQNQQQIPMRRQPKHSEKKLDTNFETFTMERLSEILTHFYLDVRTKKGKMYKANSLESLRHELNRYIKSPPHSRKFDISKDTAFNEEKL